MQQRKNNFKLMLFILAFYLLFTQFSTKVARAETLDFDKPQTQQTIQSMGFVSIQHAIDSIKLQTTELKNIQIKVQNLQAQTFNYNDSKEIVEEFTKSLQLAPQTTDAKYKQGRGGTTANLAQAYGEYKITTQALDTSIQSLQKQIANYEKKQNAMPSFWPTNSYDISSQFGYRISPGGIGSTNHQGVDISGYHGEPIYATAAGVVTMSRWYYGYGYLVEIDHGNGLTSRYAHTSKLLVYEGNNVQKGQIIAEMGATGYATGTHLHFEIRSNGTPVNPLLYVKLKA